MLLQNQLTRNIPDLSVRVISISGLMAIGYTISRGMCMFRRVVIGPDPNQTVFTLKVHGNQLQKENIGKRVVGRKTMVAKIIIRDN